MKRLNFYIDGFNLYFGMRDSGYKHCKWLDIHLLAETLKHSTHELKNVKYFTSRINNNPDKQKRQTTYLEAIATKDIEIIYGEFRTNWMKCKTCDGGWYDSKEKKTDVNIATHLMKDAFNNEFDVAILVSGDSDLTPPVKAITEIFPNKEIRIAFPPGHESNDLKKVANGSFLIGVKKLETSQLPLKVTNKYGQELEKPKEWI